VTLDPWLRSVDLIDCSGRTTHVLTVLIDGRVHVRAPGCEATVDPATRTLDPPARRLGGGEYHHDQVLDIACNLRIE
jgi:hypothetical protein